VSAERSDQADAASGQDLKARVTEQNLRAVVFADAASQFTGTKDSPKKDEGGTKMFFRNSVKRRH
jgi:hypothetical protein